MSKQDWLDYFEAVNGRSASAEEIAQALAAGVFQEEVVVPETPQAPEFVAAPTAPVEEPVAAPQAPEFVAAPTAPVEEPVAAPQAPEFVAAPTAPVEEPVAAPQAPEFVSAPAAPAAPTAPTEEPVAAPVQEPAPQAPQQAYQQPTQAAYQQAPYQGQPGQPYPAQPSQFGVAVGGYWNWFLSALKRPTVVENPKALNGILQYVLTAFVLTLSTFFTASGFTGGYGMDFRAFMLTLISLFFSLYAFQVAGFFVRRVVLQDKEYSYGRSFEEFGRLSVYTLPLALLAFLVGLVKVYEFYGFVNFLIFFLFFVGTCYVVHQGLNKTSFKADKFLLLVASSVVLLLIAIFVIYVNARILEQVAVGFIPSAPNFSNFGF
ncbi:hypothetical protein GMC85_04390 [Streptococcus parasanguinis]|uniref:DUF6574 domain-containing protein n=1 Tax=Streptococcus parasanguinis TaxID=1318 RepID=UPI0012BB8371|nr:DUF6574 domain-containing protein [Streptococcus parasanguinis]MTR53829.1 hypothetical protein [Streptococcus parasanguinis]MTR55658.1 hypothetical protein [Streptococcus parasanguinis]MTR60482.1 hypothetical protein [Streptococcus parasanguinis]MTR70533.1 hypothetical protein [Streptococcus parasanguinis]MTS02902.1 hypothetical protein [Streptococcus parasanguinis]